MNCKFGHARCLVLVLTAACGGGPNPDRAALEEIPLSQSVSGEKFTVLSSEETLRFGGGRLYGTGRVRFVQDLGGVDTAVNYVLTFSLEESGKLSLISHANASLENGLEIMFQRTGSTLTVNAKAGRVTDDWSSFFTSINASQTMKISVDVHNDESLTHVILWNDLVSASAPLLDSGADLNGAPGNGFGQNWGLKLEAASVAGVSKGGARDAH